MDSGCAYYFRPSVLVGDGRLPTILIAGRWRHDISLLKATLLAMQPVARNFKAFGSYDRAGGTLVTDIPDLGPIDIRKPSVSAAVSEAFNKLMRHSLGTRRVTDGCIKQIGFAIVDTKYIFIVPTPGMIATYAPGPALKSLAAIRNLKRRCWYGIKRTYSKLTSLISGCAVRPGRIKTGRRWIIDHIL